MTRPSAFKKAEIKRLAEIANEDRVRFQVKIGEMEITIIPEGEEKKEIAVDYRRPSL